MSQSNENHYSVYTHINKINGMQYIGCTGETPQTLRWKDKAGSYKNGQTKFHEAIMEYGWDNFDHIIIQSGMSKEEALLLEERLIADYGTVENGYNSAYGGKHNYWSDASKQKMREQRFGEKNPNFNPNKNKPTRPRSRQKDVDDSIKRKIYTFPENETSVDGRKSIEFRKKLHESKLGNKNPNFGKHSWNYGKKLTEDQKNKIKEAYTDERKQLVRERHLGSKNPQAKKVLCVTTNILYNTIVEASKETNVSSRRISECCHHRISSVKGLIFCFQKEVMQNDSA